VIGDLPTRSYAILGLLAIRDWTTYELAQQMERGVGDIWADTGQLEAVHASLTEAIQWADELQDVGRLVAFRTRTCTPVTPDHHRNVSGYR